MSNTLYRPEIDGLRALSVIAVVLFHGNLGLSGGYVGVDVFFVISGYLITSLILKELETNTFSLADFWERRIRRIFPALAVMVAAVLVAGYFLLLPSKLVGLGKSSICQSLLCANVYFWLDDGYFTAPAAQKPLLHTWSLAVEEQFYLGFPLLLYSLARFRRRTTAILLAAIAMLSLAASAIGAYYCPTASFFLLPTRAWELLAGSLLAFLPKSVRLPRAAGEAIAWLGLAAILTAVFQFDDHTRFPGVAALLPVGGAAAFIFANTCGATGAGRLLSLAPLVFVGQISYSLYLWHWPILAFLACVLGAVDTWQVAWPALALSFVAGVLSWRYVERPFRRRTPASKQSTVFVCALATQCLFVGAAGLFWTAQGFPGRVPLELRTVVADIEERNTRYESFVSELETAHVPVVGRSDRDSSSVDFALFGDSHAVALAPLFDAVSQRHNLTGLVIAKRGKEPFARSGDVRRRNDLFVDTLGRKRIKNVVMVVKWDAFVRKGDVLAELSTILESMERVGVERVFLFRQVPRQPLGDGLSQQIFFSCRLPSLVNVSRSSAGEYVNQLKDEDGFFDKLPKFSKLKIERVETSTHSFDDSGYCRVLESGRALYFDDDHLSNVGAATLLYETVESVLSRVARVDGGPS